MKLAPIILFVYNRPEHTKRTVEALKSNKLAEKSQLFIFADGPKPNSSKSAILSINAVRQYIHSIDGFKNIIIEEAEKNKGLAKSIIYGVSKILSEYKKAIIIEDDILTSPYFLTYMNKALEVYKENNKIWSISGFSWPIKFPKDYAFDVFLSQRASAWGWGSWYDRWEQIDWKMSDYYKIKKNKKMLKNIKFVGNDFIPMINLVKARSLDTWDVSWSYSQVKNDTHSLLPTKSLVKNIGLDNSGVHCRDTDTKDIVNIDYKCYNINLPKSIEPNKIIQNRLKRYLSKSLYEKIKELIISPP